jgi:lipoprotein-releasing system ATP-binding protein
MSEILLSARKIRKAYAQGPETLEILKDVSIDIRQGEAVCIVGASGAGKSTLLHILGTLDQPTSGEVFFQQHSLTEMNDDELALFRNKQMGFVFQFHHLLSEFNALENVMIPARVSGLERNEALGQAEELLRTMGLSERLTHFPSQLSGGELQRVAIARALVCKPKILFADEPTGNLDSHNGNRIQDLFFELKEKMGLTLVVVTHDPNFSRKFGHVHRISDGRWV